MIFLLYGGEFAQSNEILSPVFDFIDGVALIDEVVIDPLPSLDHLDLHLTIQSQQNQGVPPFKQLINSHGTVCYLQLSITISDDLHLVLMIEDDVFFSHQLWHREGQTFPFSHVDFIVIAVQLATIADTLLQIVELPCSRSLHPIEAHTHTQLPHLSQGTQLKQPLLV